MLTRWQISAILVLAAAVWGITLLILGVPLTWIHITPYSITLIALTVILFCFERWIWRWPIFKNWLVKRPLIQGTWKVEIHSSYFDDNGKSSPIQGIVIFRQTLSTLSMRLFTKESSSVLVAHKFQQQEDGLFQLIGTYQNIPEVQLRGNRSEIHNGTILLNVEGDPPTALKGHYWTDRKTKGSFLLSDCKEKIANNYKEGASMFGMK